MAEHWTKYCNVTPPSEIIYLGEHASPEYRKSLEDLGQKLSIPVYVCTPNGVLNERFQASWKEKLAESGHLVSEKKGAVKRKREMGKKEKVRRCVREERKGGRNRSEKERERVRPRQSRESGM